ncbi:inosamine-phosphate amidinotransferase 1 [Burkholderia ubonensis]|uniref:inosamine-phosphate amidinotransferase 1 n=1 Tax=Burkholderia ubonensis TaxID=101571 RepID=UPI000B324755|nr:inosamine-phosphate amidinotransferase 1 [Burkholderia ubonensis]
MSEMTEFVAGQAAGEHEIPAGAWSCNEWDPLVEVVVGNPFNARFPYRDKSSHIAEYAGKPFDAIPEGPFPQRMIEETEEDLGAMVDIFSKLGITVKRPDTWDHEQEFSTAYWKTKGYYNYCPRDILLVVGDQIIETPNVIRGRSQETYSYRRILLEYLKKGSRWYSAPKPMLQDSLFDVDHEKPVPRDDEPVFDAANVIRLGKDLLYLISSTGNELGAHWLQTALGKDFKVHVCQLNYYGSHIDTSVVALRPGLLLCNPDRVSKDMLPDIFNGWEVLFSPPMIGADRFEPDYLSKCIGSNWIDMNLFSLSPDLVMVDRDQLPLIRLLESKKLEVVPMKLRHSRMLGGGFHCTTLDVRRKGKMESYFD